MDAGKRVLCGQIERGLAVSAAFAGAARKLEPRLVSLGRLALKGAARAQEMFTLDGTGRA